MKRIIFLSFLFIASFSFAFEQSDMVLVQGGCFVMGKTTPHEVLLNDFYISKYEITVEDWVNYCDLTDYEFNFNYYLLSEYLLPSLEEKADLPIFTVTWVEAVEFCNWLSERDNLIPVYNIKIVDEDNDVLDVVWDVTANGYRLPTEAEWEYAARGGKYDSIISNKSLGNVAWYTANSNFNPHNVGTLKANNLGIYDMLGNVGEWCWDFFDIKYYEKSPLMNPTGSEKGYAPNYYEYDGWQPIGKVIRGGAWSYPPKWVNEYFRAGVHFYQRDSIGFRVVKNFIAEDTSK